MGAKRLPIPCIGMVLGQQVLGTIKYMQKTSNMCDFGTGSGIQSRRKSAIIALLGTIGH